MGATAAESVVESVHLAFTTFLTTLQLVYLESTGLAYNDTDYDSIKIVIKLESSIKIGLQSHFNYRLKLVHNRI